MLACCCYAEVKKEVVKLVDEKRSYNCDITLARFR